MLNIDYLPKKKDAWFLPLLTCLRKVVEDNAFWQSYLNENLDTGHLNVHLGIFVEPYLQFILDGRKTLESRFSINQTAPYNKVFSGDVLLLKRSSGPIVGLCQISEASSYVLNFDLREEIKEKYQRPLCIQDSGFWNSKERSKYVTLMKIQHVFSIPSEINFIKKDRRGWVVLHSDESDK